MTAHSSLLTPGDALRFTRQWHSEMAPGSAVANARLLRRRGLIKPDSVEYAAVALNEATPILNGFGVALDASMSKYPALLRNSYYTFRCLKNEAHAVWRKRARHMLEGAGCPHCVKENTPRANHRLRAEPA